MIVYADTMTNQWDTTEMQAAFEVLGFAFGMCIVKRRIDGVQGTLDFYRDETTNTRVYHNFMEA
jgi:hypothetical protein